MKSRRNASQANIDYHRNIKPPLLNRLRPCLFLLLKKLCSIIVIWLGILSNSHAFFFNSGFGSSVDESLTCGSTIHISYRYSGMGTCSLDETIYLGGELHSTNTLSIYSDYSKSIANPNNLSLRLEISGCGVEKTRTCEGALATPASSTSSVSSVELTQDTSAFSFSPGQHNQTTGSSATYRMTVDGTGQQLDVVGTITSDTDLNVDWEHTDTTGTIEQPTVWLDAPSSQASSTTIRWDIFLAGTTTPAVNNYTLFIDDIDSSSSSGSSTYNYVSGSSTYESVMVPKSDLSAYTVDSNSTIIITDSGSHYTFRGGSDTSTNDPENRLQLSFNNTHSFTIIYKKTSNYAHRQFVNSFRNGSFNNPTTSTLDSIPAVRINAVAIANPSNQSVYPVTGSCSMGDGDVTVAITGATPASVPVTCDSSGNWSTNFDVSALMSSNNFTVTASQTDADGDTGNATETIATSNFTCDSDAILFNNSTIQAFESGDTSNGTVEFLDGGCTLKLTGNKWQRFISQYDINANSEITFEYMSDNQGEIHGMSFDPDTSVGGSGFHAQFYGSDSWGNTSYSYTTPGSYQNFSIPVGTHYTGNNLHWVFINDKDSGSTTNTGYFRNVKFYPNGIAAASTACTAQPVNNTWFNSFFANNYGSPNSWSGANEFIVNDAGSYLVSQSRIDFSQYWELEFDLYFGRNNNNRAHGIGLFFHNDRTGPYGFGGNEQTLGITDLENAIGIEFDLDGSHAGDSTIQDHSAIVIPGSSIGSPPQVIGGLQTTSSYFDNGIYHNIRVKWKPDTQKFIYFINGVKYKVSRDIIDLDLNSNYAHWGLALLSHYESDNGNELRVRFNDFCGNTVAGAPVYNPPPLPYDASSCPVLPNGNTLFNTTGGAAWLNPRELQLAKDATNQAAGNTHAQSRIDMSHDWTLTFDVHLGSKPAGADGIGFILHNDPAGATAQGLHSGSLGITGLNNVIGIEFDNYNNWWHAEENPKNGAHIAFVTSPPDNTTIGSPRLLGGVTSLTNLEDRLYHRVVVNWDAGAQVLSYTFDGGAPQSINRNIISQDLAGSHLAYWGFSGATGGRANDHRVYLHGFCGRIVDLSNNDLVNTTTPPTPFASCPSNSFFIQDQGSSSIINEINLNTGSLVNQATHLGSVGILNGLGFNNTDNYLYAWSVQNNAVVRIGSNYATTNLAVTGLPSFAFTAGDVAPDNNHYFIYHASQGLYSIPLDPSSPNYLQASRVDSGTALTIQSSDIAFNARDNFIYSVESDGDLYRIDSSTGGATLIGNIGISSSNGFGAHYFDGASQLYISRNDDGQIFRIDTLSSSPSAQLTASGPISTQNDGARCAASGISAPPIAFASCPTTSFMVQKNPAVLYEMDLASGTYIEPTTNLGPVTSLNGLGYNTFDNYLYAWSNATNTLLKIGSNYEVEQLAISNIPPQNYNTGDISTTENAYWIYGQNRGMYKVPLDPTQPNYLQAQLIDDGTNFNADNTDLSFHPTDGFLYAVAKNGNLYRINPNDASNTLLGHIGVSGTGGTGFGAQYFDANGYLFISRNSDGHIFRINVNATSPTAQLFAYGPGSVSFNDGARCSNTAIPTTGFANCPALPAGNTLTNLTGGAVWLSANELQLTPNLANQAGNLSSLTRIDLTQSWLFDFDVYLGTRTGEWDGGDGIGFVLHNDPAGDGASGNWGSALGITGLDNAIGVEFDTYYWNQRDTDPITNDHTAIVIPYNLQSGDVDDTAPVTVGALVDQGNIEDGAYHNVVVEWNALSQTFSYQFDNGPIQEVNRDIKQDISGNLAYWGFAASTGTAFNEQRVRLNSFCGNMLDSSNNAISNVISDSTDTDGDGVPDVIDLDDDGDGMPDTAELASRNFTVDTDNDGALDDNTDLLVIAGWYHNFPNDTTAQDGYSTTISASASGFDAMLAGSGGTWGASLGTEIPISSALPPGADGRYINLASSARGQETVGSGLNANTTDDTTAAIDNLGVRSIDSGMNQSSMADAITDFDYLEYRFTTADSFDANSEVYFAAITASDLTRNTTNFDIAIAISTDDFNNSTTLLEDYTFTQGLGTRVINITPYQLRAATTYKVRAYLYNHSGNQEARFDNFQIAIKHYDQRHSDDDNLADHRDLDADNDAINDVIEASGLIDADGNGIADGSDANNDGMIDSFNNTPVDTDGDGYANYRDVDSDDASEQHVGNGVGDDLVGFAVYDSDGDGKLDFLGEVDRDGIMNIVDGDINYYGDASGSMGIAITGIDTDGDSIPNVIDLDDDGDGMPDTTELAIRSHTIDADSDGVIDDSSNLLVVAGWFHNFPNNTLAQDAYATTISASAINVDSIRAGSGGTWGINTAAHINVPSALPPGANGHYINLDNSQRGVESTGLGLLSNTVIDEPSLIAAVDTLIGSSGGASGTRNLDDGIDRYTFNDAVLSSDYLEYSFTTANHFDVNSEVYLAAISATDFTLNTSSFDIAVVVSEDNFTSSAVVLQDHTFAAGAGNRVINLTPYQLQHSRSYQVRVYFYNPSAPLNNQPEMIFDDFQIAVQHFDQRFSDLDSLPDHLDLDSDNDSINDVIEAGSLSDLNGDGLADGADNNNDGIIDSFNNNPLDTDGDSFADYRDIDRDSAVETYLGDGIGDDIQATDLAALDGDLDGQIDSQIDGDLDGITKVADGDPNTYGDSFGMVGCIAVETLSLSLADNWDTSNGDIGVRFDGSQTQRFTSPSGYPYDITVSTSGTPDSVENLDNNVGPALENQTYTVSFTESLSNNALNVSGFQFYLSDFERDQNERLSAFSYVTSDGSLIASKPAWNGWQDSSGNALGNSGSLLGTGGSLNLWANYNATPGHDTGKYIYFDLSSQPLSQFSFTQLNFGSVSGSSVAGFDPSNSLTACFTTPLPTLKGFNIRYDGSSNTCEPSDVVITACQDNATPCTPYTNFNGTVELDSSINQGTWSVAPGYTLHGALSQAGDADGQARYQFAAADHGEIRLRFNYVGNAPLQLSVTESGVASPLSSRTELLSFLTRVLRITDTQPHVAGKPLPITAAVYRDSGAGSCGIDTSYHGTANLKAWITRHINDAQGAAPTINGVSLPSLPPAVVNNVNLDFTNGEATFNLNSTDIGQYQLNLRDDSYTLVNDNFEGISQRFTMRPFGFALSFGSDPNAANANANDANGSAFKVAGQDFNTTVRAVTWQAADDSNADGLPDNGVNLNDNATLISFGRENQRETISISHSLQQPVGGADGSLNGDIKLSHFIGGSAIADLHYSEVGIIDLQAELLDQRYLDTDTNLIGTASNVGRFIPDHFAVTAQNTTNACNTASYPFTYIGEPFSMSYTLTAYNIHGQLTQNYTGAFSKLNLNSANNSRFAFSDNGPLHTLTDRLNIYSWAGNSFWNNGIGSASGYLLLNRGAVEAPMSNLYVSIDPLDADGVGLQNTAYDIDSTGFGGLDHQRIGSPINLRYGRARITNGYGSELLEIEMPISIEHYVALSNGQFDFVPHENDNCTNINMGHIGFGNFEGNLSQNHIQLGDLASTSGGQTYDPYSAAYTDDPVTNPDTATPGTTEGTTQTQDPAAATTETQGNSGTSQQTTGDTHNTTSTGSSTGTTSDPTPVPDPTPTPKPKGNSKQRGNCDDCGDD